MGRCSIYVVWAAYLARNRQDVMMWTEKQIELLTRIGVQTHCVKFTTCSILIDGMVFYSHDGATEWIHTLSGGPSLVSSHYEAWSDGSGTTAQHHAGIGVYIRPARGGLGHFISQNVGPGTNNRAELLAAWTAIQYFSHPAKCRLTVYTDSAYVIGVMGKNTATANFQLVEAMRQDIEMRRAANMVIDFVHVPGHSGVEGNEVADRLAYVGRKILKTPKEYGLRG